MKENVMEQFSEHLWCWWSSAVLCGGLTVTGRHRTAAVLSLQSSERWQFFVSVLKW